MSKQEETFSMKEARKLIDITDRLLGQDDEERFLAVAINIEYIIAKSADAYIEALKDMVKLVGEVEEGLSNSERKRWGKAAALIGVELE